MSFYIMLIGFVAAFGTTFAFVPQLLKIIRTQKTDDISLIMYIIYIIGIVAWLVYGLLLNQLPIIIANIISFGFALTILIFKIKSIKKQEKNNGN